MHILLYKHNKHFKRPAVVRELKLLSNPHLFQGPDHPERLVSVTSKMHKNMSTKFRNWQIK